MMFMIMSENTNLRGSIAVGMADILFILFGFSCFAYRELKQFYLSGRIETSRTVIMARKE